MTHGEAVEAGRAREEREHVRRSLGVSDDQVLFGVFGALTPEKRVPQVLDAFADIRRYATGARLVLAGAAASHYDVAADVDRRDLDPVVIRTGYLADEALTGHLLACDVSINLRWPTAREMSGPWLRALAAGLPTIVMDLEHMADVPTLDPRSWTVAHSRPTGHPSPTPVAVAIDILDEAHSLRLAMRRLATDATLRAELGAAAAAHWQREHSRERMVGDYRRAITRAMERPATTSAAPHWPAHLTDRGDRLLNELLGSMGVSL
jgi:glycosyltransferase involved in cell wall biosynthesis